MRLSIEHDRIQKQPKRNSLCRETGDQLHQPVSTAANESGVRSRPLCGDSGTNNGTNKLLMMMMMMMMMMIPTVAVRDYAVLASQGIDQSPAAFRIWPGTATTIGSGAYRHRLRSRKCFPADGRTIGPTYSSELNAPAPACGKGAGCHQPTSNASPATTSGPGPSQAWGTTQATSPFRADPALVSTIPDRSVQVAKPLAAKLNTTPPTAVIPDQSDKTCASIRHLNSGQGHGSRCHFNPAGPCHRVSRDRPSDHRCNHADRWVISAVRTDIGPESAHMAPATLTRAPRLRNLNLKPCPAHLSRLPVPKRLLQPMTRVAMLQPHRRTTRKQASRPHAYSGIHHASAAGVTQIASTSNGSRPGSNSSGRAVVSLIFSRINAMAVTTAAPAPPNALIFTARITPPLSRQPSCTDNAVDQSGVSATQRLPRIESAKRGQPPSSSNNRGTAGAHPGCRGLMAAVAATASGAAITPLPPNAAAKTRLQRLLKRSRASNLTHRPRRISLLRCLVFTSYQIPQNTATLRLSCQPLRPTFHRSDSLNELNGLHPPQDINSNQIPTNHRSL